MEVGKQKGSREGKCIKKTKLGCTGEDDDGQDDFDQPQICPAEANQTGTIWQIRVWRSDRGTEVAGSDEDDKGLIELGEYVLGKRNSNSRSGVWKG